MTAKESWRKRLTDDPQIAPRHPCHRGVRLSLTQAQSRPNSGKKTVF